MILVILDDQNTKKQSYQNEMNRTFNSNDTPRKQVLAPLCSNKNHSSMLSFRELISLDELASLDTFRDLQEVKFPFPLGVVGGVGVIVAGVAVNVPSSIGKAWPASSRTFAKFSVRLMERNLSQG